MNKSELIFVVVTLFLVATLGFASFRSSEVKSRDVQRKGDLKHIRDVLNAYFKEVGSYPVAVNGKIAACGETFDEVCLWGQDKIVNPRRPSQVFITVLPGDPLTSQGFEYRYESNTRNTQFFARLERIQDDEYNKKVVARGLFCGQGLCSFGVTSSGDVKPEEELPSTINH